MGSELIAAKGFHRLPCGALDELALGFREHPPKGIAIRVTAGFVGIHNLGFDHFRERQAFQALVENCCIEQARGQIGATLIRVASARLNNTPPLASLSI
jgi:hypothetical protein